MNHTPVMVDETLRYLLHGTSRRILDCTIGGGGHAEAILDSNSRISLVAVDRDPEALVAARRRLASYPDRVEFIEGNYGDIDRLLPAGRTFDGVLVDLGVSSLHLEKATRGFSYRNDGPLDMRMGSSGPTAKSFIDRATVEELSRTLKEYGEVRGATRIAKSIRRAVDNDAMSSTFDLRKAVDDAVAGTPSPSFLSKVFQSIRIAVNGELENLDAFLRKVPRRMNRDGRLVIISFHSLEHRMVKNFLKRESSDCICPPDVPQCVCGHTASLEVMTRRVVRPTAAEAAANARSRSAGLRAARLFGSEREGWSQ